MTMARRWPALTLVAVLTILLTTRGASRADESSEIEVLRQEIEALQRRDAERERELKSLREEMQRLHRSRPAHVAEPAQAPPPGEPEETRVAPAAIEPPGTSPLDRAVAELDPGPGQQQPLQGVGGGAIFSRRLGRAQLQLLDIGMDVLTSVGGSTASDPEIRQLQQGFHDPRRRGFTLQQAELSLAGAVDPYFRGDVFIVATPDAVELEEAFLTSTALPWGLQLEAGTFFTEFGINNTQHPHQWDWIDQPVVNSRLFGGEALRGPGVRLGWLTPLPWFSELHVGAQNANEGEFTSSFIGEDQVGGRPTVKQDVDGMGDLLYLARWVNSWDLDNSLTTRIGVSGLFGPNGTGNDGRTYVYGMDMTWLWQPPDSFRGWPYVRWDTEVMKRDFTADRFHAGTAVDDEGGEEDDDHAHGVTASREAGDVVRLANRQDEEEEGEFHDDISGDILRDWGLYTQVLWGPRFPWSLGLRYEYASGSGDSLPDGRSSDSLRDDRHRVSPLIVWQPTEFSRFRLQYNYDHAEFLDDDDAHSVWFSMEILYGDHMAHDF